MIKLDQVQLLEDRVAKAVRRITELHAENVSLKERIVLLEKQNAELAKQKKDMEDLVSMFEEDQTRIEQGIQSALDRLSQVEDTVFHTKPAETPAAQPVPSVQPGSPAEQARSGGIHTADERTDPSVQSVKYEQVSVPEFENGVSEQKAETPPAAPQNTDGQFDIF